MDQYYYPHFIDKKKAEDLPEVTEKIWLTTRIQESPIVLEQQFLISHSPGSAVHISVLLLFF